MQQELVNPYQFLHHVASVIIFQVKTYTNSIFCWFCGLEINFNSEKWQTNFMSGNDKKFCRLSADSGNS